jgi:hypothetical protein
MTEAGDGDGLLWFRNVPNNCDASINVQTPEVS